MKLIGLTPLRNEAAFAAMTVRASLRWCDEVIALDHASTDDTREILEQIAAETGRLTILREPNPEWAEMEHRQKLLSVARLRGATHCAIIDGDEILSGNLLEWIREQVERLQSGQLLQIPMRNMWRSLDQYRSDPSPFGCMALTTVAFAISDALSWRNANGYPHHHREPYGHTLAYRCYPIQLPGGVMHLQFSHWRRLVAKQVLYRMSEAVRFPERNLADIERMYSLSTDESTLETTPAPSEWWEPYSDIRPLYRGAEPIWQEDACRALMSKHGPETFTGLRLMGVA
jgi:hypothetical protein